MQRSVRSARDYRTPSSNPANATSRSHIMNRLRMAIPFSRGQFLLAHGGRIISVPSQGMRKDGGLVGVRPATEDGMQASRHPQAIATKVLPPRGVGLIERSRLLELVTQVPMKPLSVIKAPSARRLWALHGRTNYWRAEIPLRGFRSMPMIMS